MAKEMNKVAKNSIRKPSVICALWGLKGAQLRRRRAFETKEVKAGAAGERE